MNERRRFLVVLGASAAALAEACGGTTNEASGAQSQSGAGGAGGQGGQGGGAGQGGAAGAGGQGGAGGSCTPMGSSAGDLSKYANNGVFKVQNTKFLIGRDADG